MARIHFITVHKSKIRTLFSRSFSKENLKRTLSGKEGIQFKYAPYRLTLAVLLVGSFPPMNCLGWLIQANSLARIQLLG